MTWWVVAIVSETAAGYLSLYFAFFLQEQSPVVTCQDDNVLSVELHLLCLLPCSQCKHVHISGHNRSRSLWIKKLERPLMKGWPLSLPCLSFLTLHSQVMAVVQRTLDPKVTQRRKDDLRVTQYRYRENLGSYFLYWSSLPEFFGGERIVQVIVVCFILSFIYSQT